METAKRAGRTAFGEMVTFLSIFMKYPGRFNSMHLQDWNAETKTAAAVGKGSIDWKRVFSAAKIGGVKNYFIEQNMEMTREGVAFLKALKV